MPSEKTSPMNGAPIVAQRLRPETKLILACCRTQVDDGAVQLIRSLLGGHIDWEDVIRQGHQHGVAPLLFRTLSATCPELVPEESMDKLRSFFQSNGLYNLLRTRELLKLLNLMQAEGIDALPFKGPVLAAAAYGDLALRQFGDLDVLVRKQDFAKAKTLLLAQGYRRAIKPSPVERLLPLRFRGSGKDLVLVKAEGHIVIELHWRLSGGHFSFPINLKDLWGRLEVYRLGDSVVPSLPRDELLMYLCVHGSRHSWERLAWICDVAELVRMHPEIDCNSLLNRARALGSERMVALGLILARDLLGVRLPADVSARIQTDPKVRLVATRVRELLFQQEDHILDISYLRHHHLLVRERLRDRVRVYLHYCRRYFHVAVTPNERDHELLSLPSSLSFLYYLMRPIRLLREFGRSKSQRLIGRLLCNPPQEPDH